MMQRSLSHIVRKSIYCGRYFHTTAVRSTLTQVPMAPPDGVLGLVENYNMDENPNKINLTVGVYKDVWVQVTTFPSVAQAQKIIDMDGQMNTDLSYLPISGCEDFKKHTIDFLYRDGCPHDGPALIDEGRISFVQTLSGTGALAVTAKLISSFISTKIWIPKPSWPNHTNIFKKNGFTDIYNYSYYSEGQLTIDKWLQELRDIVSKDKSGIPNTIVLHACCHNPTGLDPTRKQWEQIIDVIHELKMVPIIDMAYQGLESGNLIDDAYLLRLCLDKSRYRTWPNGLYLCQSFAKNMGLYGERVGSLSIVTPDSIPKIKEILESQLKQIIRSMYSSPPGYGSRVAKLVLSNDKLKYQWYDDVRAMVARLKSVRTMISERLGWEDIINFEQQHGMFYYTNLNPGQVKILRDDFSVYLTNDGRMSLSGVNKSNVDYLCNSIKATLHKMH
ncbi:aspartate transaminase AAT1 [Nakaseomyces bracarensis]|uniref:aspartate transaminase AAT1 n=1 Tax=Nakaseomyces bracarensis TaxID=273131 RepID=UPI003872272F